MLRDQLLYPCQVYSGAERLIGLDYCPVGGRGCCCFWIILGLPSGTSPLISRAIKKNTFKNKSLCDISYVPIKKINQILQTY